MKFKTINIASFILVKRNLNTRGGKQIYAKLSAVFFFAHCKFNEEYKIAVSNLVSAKEAALTQVEFTGKCLNSLLSKRDHLIYSYLSNDIMQYERRFKYFYFSNLKAQNANKVFVFHLICLLFLRTCFYLSIYLSIYLIRLSIYLSISFDYLSIYLIWLSIYLSNLIIYLSIYLFGGSSWRND